MIYARKIYKIPEFYTIFARKMPEFYVIIARKIFFPNFSGARAFPAPPSLTPMGLRHVLGDGRANVTHSPDVVIRRLTDCSNVVDECQVFVQRYAQDFNVDC